MLLYEKVLFDKFGWHNLIFWWTIVNYPNVFCFQTDTHRLWVRNCVNWCMRVFLSSVCCIHAYIHTVFSSYPTVKCMSLHLLFSENNQFQIEQLITFKIIWHLCQNEFIYQLWKYKQYNCNMSVQHTSRLVWCYAQGIWLKYMSNLSSKYVKVIKYISKFLQNTVLK